MTSHPFGLYIHIPFCAQLCHYCDFAKTANFTGSHVQAYFDRIQAHLSIWLNHLSADQKFSSVFFGGGTPGLFASEYLPILTILQDRLAKDAEISMEVNPTNVTEEKVRIWKGIGINRISVGIQSFDPQGLVGLTRDHDFASGLRALELVSKHFRKSNGDLIYGWHGQTIPSWRRDLKLMCQSGVNHVSLYALTLEGQTPFARAARRGVLKSTPDDLVAEMYDEACAALSRDGFSHDEVSNWSMPGYSCDHNWLYWRQHAFLGIGAGAHGLLENNSNVGIRYSYPSDLRQFLRHQHIDGAEISAFEDVILYTGGAIDSERTLDSWLLEYVGCSLRSRDGVDLRKLAEFGFQFSPTQVLKRAFVEGLISIENNIILASEAEWFRETAWSSEIIQSLRMI